MQAPERSWESWVRLSAKSSPPPGPPRMQTPGNRSRS